MKTINPNGSVQIHGEFWRATAEEVLKKGIQVKVVKYNGKDLTLKVEKI